MVEFLNRYVSIQKEGTTYGSTSSGGTEVYGEVDDESFAHNFDLLTRQDMSRQIASKSVTGTEYSEGGINMAVQVDDFTGNILAAFFPKTAVASSVHTFSEPVVAADAYNSYTIQVGREEKEHTYTGMVGSSLSMTANVGEYVMMSADFVGKAESDVAAIAGSGTVTFHGDALDALYFANGSVIFNDGSGGAQATASLDVKSFSFDISLNRDQDNAYALGTNTYNRAPASQRREISGSIEFNKVIYTATSDEPTYQLLTDPDGLAMSDDAADPTITLNLQSELNNDSEYIKVNFYNVRFEAPSANVSGRDTNTMSVNFVGLYDNTASGANKAMDITVKGGAISATAL